MEMVTRQTFKREEPSSALPVHRRGPLCRADAILSDVLAELYGYENWADVQRDQAQRLIRTNLCKPRIQQQWQIPCGNEPNRPLALLAEKEDRLRHG